MLLILPDCYGMHYASTKSASERRKTLKKWFNFDCRCGACSAGGGYATEKRSVAAGDELLRTALADFKVYTKLKLTVLLAIFGQQCSEISLAHQVVTA